MLKIGDFSKLARVSIRMLRHYDEIGLLVPKSTDGFTGYRYYAESQLPAAGRIAALRDMGFGLAAIGEIVKRYDDPKALAAFLSVRKAEVKAEAEEVQRRLLRLEKAVTRLRKDEMVMKYDTILKELPERYVASVRQVISAYEDEGMLWGILMGETASLKLQDTNPSYTLAIFHDKEYKDANVDVEVQKSVKGSYPNTEHVTFKKEPAVLVASATYKGSYAQMNAINEAVAGWVQKNAFEFVGPAFNIYHVSPHETQDPDEYVTEVCYPVKKK